MKNFNSKLLNIKPLRHMQLLSFILITMIGASCQRFYEEPIEVPVDSLENGIPDMPIYVFTSTYAQWNINMMEASDVDFRDIKIMVKTDLVNPATPNVIDYQLLEDKLDEKFPVNSNDVLCLDLENKFYNDLKGNNLTRYPSVSEEVYQEAIDVYVELITFVKQKRPHLTVGVYGMPFKLFDISEKEEGSDGKLDPILEVADVIFNSVYIPYPAAFTSKEANFLFLKNNLDLALNYGSRLNKPVIPFFWYLVFSPDEHKELRNELLPRQEVYDYMNYIKNYESSGTKVSGLIWWDSQTPYYKNNYLIKKNFLPEEDRAIDSSRNMVFRYYFPLADN